MPTDQVIVIETIPEQPLRTSEFDGNYIVETVPAAPTVVEVFTEPIGQIEVQTAGPRGPRGEKGDKGDPGQQGNTGTGRYEEYEFTNLAIWMVDYSQSFGGVPTVILTDVNNEQFFSSVSYPSEGIVLVKHGKPTSGKMTLRA